MRAVTEAAKSRFTQEVLGGEENPFNSSWFRKVSGREQRARVFC